MKAAILYKKGEAPKYGEIEAPVTKGDNEVLITVKAASIKNLDKSRASGAHYSSANPLQKPETVGVDGVGYLEDGTRIYAAGISGMIAEKAVVNAKSIVRLPDNLDDITAAALPNAVLGACGAIQFKANVQSGQTVLINGATGVTGMVAVQIAKLYGAKKVIVTGRNADTLTSLLQLGADEAISLKDDEEIIIENLKRIHKQNPIDVVVDYLWGKPAELILAALLGDGGNTHAVKFVTVGSMAGDKIELSSAVLRSSDIELSGSGFGSLSPQNIAILFKEILPKMFQYAAEGKLKIETVTAKLEDVESAWTAEIPSGKRLVIAI
ncbi:quinone oxidoreductase family protein [Pedobacter nototheniae]|uniref:quinone oxidoreductase family protein n=1 Tax=Pedobacter nototheniae TaxID=2488994 RepID=UPI00103F5763|nr:zinc-binding alcohol dehydrogenase family protein [Pedobacter nototheniae]